MQNLALTLLILGFLSPFGATFYLAIVPYHPSKPWILLSSTFIAFFLSCIGIFLSILHHYSQKKEGHNPSKKHLILAWILWIISLLSNGALFILLIFVYLSTGVR